jgi:hypothetical protein
MNFRGSLTTHENEGFPGCIMFSWRRNTHEIEVFCDGVYFFMAVMNSHENIFVAVKNSHENILET